MAASNCYHLGLKLVLLGIFPALCHHSSLGSYSGVLDRMGAGIAELGSGNTGTARKQAVPAAYWNPALLAFQRHTTMAVGGEIRSLDRNGGMLGIQGRIAPNMGLGLGIVNRGDINVPINDRNENFLGTARPQDIGFYLGLGIKTSRKNSYGATLQWYYSGKDIGGAGDINFIGIINLGWYRSWTSNLRTGIVLRNLGLNSTLSSHYELKTGMAQDDFGLDITGEDFFPKTFVAAGAYSFKLMERKLDVYFEFLDFQLADRFFDIDRDHHAMDIRAGADWRFSSEASVRTGYDRGNFSFGFGYRWKNKKGKAVIFDYALLLERGAINFNPFAMGLRYEL